MGVHRCENRSVISIFDSAAYPVAVNPRTPTCESRVADRKKSSKMHNSACEGRRALLGHRRRSEQGKCMNTLRKARKALVIACVVPLAAFGVAACGSDDKAGGGGVRWRWRWRRRRDQHHDDVVPRLRRPAAVLHGGGLGGAVERLHPAADLQARQGQGRHRGRARPGRGHAGDLAGRQDLQAQAAART